MAGAAPSRVALITDMIFEAQTILQPGGKAEEKKNHHYFLALTLLSCWTPNVSLPPKRKTNIRCLSHCIKFLVTCS